MGKVTWGFTASIDGFIAGPDHDMSWMETADGLTEESTEQAASAVGAILSGRRGYDAARRLEAERSELTAEAYGGAWHGPEFILTHRPEELADDASVTALDCSVDEAIRIGLEAAGDGNLQIISADIARQALELDLIDELQVYCAPVFLGDGTRIFDVPGGRRIDWELVAVDESARSLFARTYRPRRSAG